MSPRPLAAGSYFPYDADFISLGGLFKNDVGVDVATLRRFGGQFGRCVAVEQGVTNLYTQTQFDTLLGGYNATNGQRPQDVTNITEGWRRVPKIDGLGVVTNTEIFVNASPAATAGERYTFVAHFRTNGTITFPGGSGIVYFATGGSNTSVTAVITDLGGGVFRIAGTGVANTGVTALRVSLFPSWGTATYVEFVEWMFFAHTGTIDTVTEIVNASHVWGTRADGVLKYPGALLPRTAGTVSCWIRPNYDYRNFPSADGHGIVSSTTVNANDQFQLWIAGDGTGRIRFQTYVGAILVVDIDHLPADWSPNRLHHVACSWSNVEQVLYYDGIRRATRSGIFTRWSQATWVTVGTGSSPSSPNDWLEGLIDDLAIIPRQLTDAQIAAIVAA